MPLTDTAISSEMNGFWSPPKREKVMSLGAYPDVSLAQARDGVAKARKFLRRVKTRWPFARLTRWQPALPPQTLLRP